MIFDIYINLYVMFLTITLEKIEQPICEIRNGEDIFVASDKNS